MKLQIILVQMKVNLKLGIIIIKNHLELKNFNIKWSIAETASPLPIRNKMI